MPQLPAQRHTSLLAGDMDRIPILSIRKNGKISAICNLGVVEFLAMAGVGTDTYYRIIRRQPEDNTTGGVRHAVYQNIANTINLLRERNEVDSGWVILNFKRFLPRPATPIVSHTRKARAAVMAGVKALKVLDHITDACKETNGTRHLVKTAFRSHQPGYKPITPTAIFQRMEEENDNE